MKNAFTLLFALLLGHFAFSQGKNISIAKKSKTPYITLSSDTISVDQQLLISTGSNIDGGFKYVQLLNNLNEPIRAAESRFAMKKQSVKFFKEQDGTTYAFTSLFVINIEAAIQAKEVVVK